MLFIAKWMIFYSLQFQWLIKTQGWAEVLLSGLLGVGVFLLFTHALVVKDPLANCAPRGRIRQIFDCLAASFFTAIFVLHGETAMATCAALMYLYGMVDRAQYDVDGKLIR